MEESAEGHLRRSPQVLVNGPEVFYLGFLLFEEKSYRVEGSNGLDDIFVLPVELLVLLDHDPDLVSFLQLCFLFVFNIFQGVNFLLGLVFEVGL